jgi:hypothetical protein
MQFVFDGKFYKAIKITGPRHNMLGLVLDKNSNHEIDVIALRSSKDESNNISSLDVKDQVLSGVEAINHKFGVKYTVEKIQFVSSDTPSESVYKELTIEILKRIIAGEEFIRV